MFTQNIDSNLDSTKALINKIGRALPARQSGFCRAFVELNVESMACANVSKVINIDGLIGAIIGLCVGVNFELFALFLRFFENTK